MSRFRRAAAVLCLVGLTACDKPASPPASQAAPTEAAPVTQEAASGCQSLAAWRRQGKGEFEVLMQRTEAGFQVQMQLVQGGQRVQDAVLMPAWAEESITIGDEDIPEFTTVCADRWFVLNLPSERGGSLIVGERLNGGLAMVETGYASSDEDTAKITWGAGMPMVSSGQPGDPWPLKPLDEKAVLAPGAGAPVELKCESKDQARGEQSLTLALDSAGRLSRIGYFSVAPEGMSCSVDARRSGENPQTASTWQDAPHQATIRWGKEAPDASTLVVTSRDGRYTVDTRELRLSEFCGQSTEIALTIGLQAGQAKCTVTWPQEDTAAQPEPKSEVQSAAPPEAAAPAVAKTPEFVPSPGFDCKAAKTPAERLICSRSALSRLDAQATRLYSQARPQAQDAAAFKKEQLAWLRERDAECIADASWDEVRKDERVAGCMAMLYASRIRTLRDMVAPPLLPSALLPVSDAARQTTGLARKGCEAMQGAFGEQGKVLAVEVNCERAREGRRVWLIERGERAVAATPELGAGDPHDERIRTTGTNLYWDGDTLYTFTSMEQKGKGADDESDWLAANFTATVRNGSTRIESIPKRIELFFGERIGAFFGDDEGRLMNGIDDAIGDGGLSLGRRHTPTGKTDADGTQHFSVQNSRLVWIGNPGAETYTLHMMNFERKNAVTEIARGGPELLRLVFDNWHVIYPSMDGLLVFDLLRETTQRIAGTTVDDLPLAWDPASGTLAWSSSQPCGGAKAPAGGRFVCIAHLDGVRMP